MVTNGAVIKETTPTIFTIFGITGDLAQRKLLPSLLSLYSKKLLPQKFAVVGFGRRQFSRSDFRQFVRDEMHIKHGQFKEEDVKHFIDHIIYEQGFFDNPLAYETLATRFEAIDKEFGRCSNKLFHLSVPPSLYEIILRNLAASGLTIPCGGNLGWTRVLVEKPFGSDTNTAAALDTLLGELFKEEQIFRIDHYLAKETVQNILAFRFANSLFEPLWSHRHIEKVEIKLLEKIGLEGRGAFYDSLGALKDVGQNHILQMLAIIAMDQPECLDATSIRQGRAKVLKHLSPINYRNIHLYGERGQYAGYKEEHGVSPESETETYFKIKATIDSARWKNVPFILESGKALSESRAEIAVYFKNPDGDDRSNKLTFRIQPHEGIELHFWVKTPGLEMLVEPHTMNFFYKDISQAIPDAYEKVLFDAIIGDQTLFTSTDEVHYAWRFITPIIESWDRLPLMTYQKGSKKM
jgi:glucose-6-phosphate 1-dehydrogenase